MEVRFVSTEPWQVMPGLLYGAVRDRYSSKEDLPLAQMPSEAREQHPSLRFQSLVRFKSDRFMLQLGPRVLNVIYSGNAYPGWTTFRAEMEWLLPKLKDLGIVQSVGRLALRYIDFFDGDAVPNLQVEFSLRGERVTNREVSFITVIEREDFRLRLQINNRSTLRLGNEPRPGTILDLDTWISGEALDLHGKGLEYLDAAHEHQKRLFFEMLDREYLDSLNPEYK